MNLNSTSEKFIQQNSLDGGFLQSETWRKFQESFGHQTFQVVDENFHASIIEHELPLVGKYFYLPRGPIFINDTEKFSDLVDLAKKENAGWIRFDTNNSQSLDIIEKNLKVVKAPHDMQPREIFLIDISKAEEELLSEMKSKTRYNIRLAEKKEVKIFTSREEQDVDIFLELIKITAKRDGIVSHPEEYYRKMFENISEENLKLYLAEYEGKIIVANLVVFYGDTATYLHGASDNEYRNVMAPYLTQWRQIQDAKNAGCKKYDFGGIKTNDDNSWAGITKFKTGFSPNTKAMEFLGSYDIIINPFRYYTYRLLQKIKSFL